MLSGAWSWGAWWRPAMGVFDFPDLTFKKSGVTSKGLNKNRRGGNHSHSAAWILISYLAQGDTRGERFRDVGRLQSTFKNQQIKKQGAHGESRDIEKLQLRGIFGSMWRALLMGLNETITALLLIAFVLSHESIDSPNVNVFCSPRSPHEAAMNSTQHLAKAAPEPLSRINSPFPKNWEMLLCAEEKLRAQQQNRNAQEVWMQKQQFKSIRIRHTILSAYGRWILTASLLWTDWFLVFLFFRRVLSFQEFPFLILANLIFLFNCSAFPSECKYYFYFTIQGNKRKIQIWCIKIWHKEGAEAPIPSSCTGFLDWLHPVKEDEHRMKTSWGGLRVRGVRNDPRLDGALSSLILCPCPCPGKAFFTPFTTASLGRRMFNTSGILWTAQISGWGQSQLEDALSSCCSQASSRFLGTAILYLYEK